MFQWVLFVRRNLKPEELFFAIFALLEGAVSRRPPIPRTAVEGYITRTSHGLLEVRKGGIEVVQFIHESLYMDSYWELKRYKS